MQQTLLCNISRLWVIGRAGQTNSRYLGVSLQLTIFLAEAVFKKLWIRPRPSCFLRVHKFPLYKPHFFKQQIKIPCFQRVNRRSIAAMCSLLLEVADGFCRIKVGSTMNAFKATEFKSESALNCLIQKVNSSMKLFPARLDGTLDIFFL